MLAGFSFSRSLFGPSLPVDTCFEATLVLLASLKGMLERILFGYEQEEDPTGLRRTLSKLEVFTRLKAMRGLGEGDEDAGAQLSSTTSL